MGTPDADALPIVALVRKLAYLWHLAPDEVRGVELLVDDALERHRDEARARRLAMFRRVK